MDASETTGENLIGDFAYARHLDGRLIALEMMWSDQKQRIARLYVPRDISEMAQKGDFPPLGEDFNLESGLSYAVFLAMKVDLPLVLCGDRSVWDDRWGTLKLTTRTN